MKRILGIIASALLITGPAQAQQAEGAYPQRPVRMVIPYPAGGPVDVIGRHIAKSMSEYLRQSIVVDNRPGASGSIGAGEVARAAPDGYTLLFAQSDAFINVTVLYKQLSYDPLKDFSLIGQAVSGSAVMMVRPDAPGATLRQWLDAAKAQARPPSYGSWGAGSYSHLVGATLAQRSGVPLVHVPYRGGAPSIQDFLGGHIQAAFAGLPPGRDFRAKGQARLVAVTGPKRSPVLPDVPTFAEQGFDDPIFQLPIWLGLAAPAGTPPGVIERVHAALAAALKSAETSRFLADFGQEATGTTPAEFRAALARELPLVTQIIRAAGVEPE